MASSFIAKGPFDELCPGVRHLLATPPDGSELNGRLRDVLGCLLEGLSEKQIAARLRLSAWTVHGYVKQVYRRFGADSHAQLMFHVYRSALTSLCASRAQPQLRSVSFTSVRPVVACSYTSLGEYSFLSAPRGIAPRPPV
jgi:DNA-binding CsgD family transcriptional regulator